MLELYLSYQQLLAQDKGLVFVLKIDFVFKNIFLSFKNIGTGKTWTFVLAVIYIYTICIPVCALQAQHEHREVFFIQVQVAKYKFARIIR